MIVASFFVVFHWGETSLKQNKEEKKKKETNTQLSQKEHFKAAHIWSLTKRLLNAALLIVRRS